MIFFKKTFKTIPFLKKKAVRLSFGMAFILQVVWFQEKIELSKG